MPEKTSRRKLGRNLIIVGILLVVIALGSNLAANAWIWTQPWKTERLAAFSSNQNPLLERTWTEHAFYLYVAQFPKVLDGDPIPLSLPYLKGPPSQYPERVILHLGYSGSTLTLEGPVTPPGASLLTSAWPCLRQGGWMCLSERRKVLETHIHEPIESAEIFSVDENHNIGLHIISTTAEHYLLVTGRGAVLSMSLSPPSKSYSEALQLIVRSMILFDNPKNAADHSRIKLGQAQVAQVLSIKDTQSFLVHALDLQTTLIGRFTSHPSDGEALLFASKIAEEVNQRAGVLESIELKLKASIDSYLGDLGLKK